MSGASRLPVRAILKSGGFESTAATPGGSTPQSGSPSGTPAPETAQLVEQYNYAFHARPFKNPDWGKKASNRRPKSAKMIIQLERERYMKPTKKRGRAGYAFASAYASAAPSVAPTTATTPVDGVDVEEEAKAALENVTEPEVVRKEFYIAYHEYDAPPSLKPAKKYCDVTGLVAIYTDPKSRLRYHNADIYQLLKGFSSGAEQEYLGLRGQRSML